MAVYETRVRDVLDRAGIRIGGSNPWDVQVHDPSLYRRLVTHGSLALGESYSEGLWSCAAVDQFIH
ncbi:MAG: cyclopropane-fatty-acyl-phospholipid synthase, partial [Myxococcota bacterium]